MTIKSGFFNSVNGDRTYLAGFFAEYFSSFIANGVFPNPSTGFQVVQGTNMTVKLSAGQAWINGYYISNDAFYNIALTNADGLLNRRDRIVLQLNYLNREIVPVLKTGTFASTPVAPTLQRDTDIYEIALADIYVAAGAISIIQANITDQRLNTALCGIVHGTIDQVDTATIYDQYQSWLETTSVEKELEFDAWFQTVQDVLDTNAAGNLQNQINAINQTIIDNRTESLNEFIEMREYSTYKTNKDADGIFKTIQLKRANGTLYMQSVLSGGTAPKYTTRTETWYENDGSTIYRQKVYSRVYDVSGSLTDEVIV